MRADDRSDRTVPTRRRPHWLRRPTLSIAAIALAAVMASATPASADRGALNAARAELMRTHVRLTRAAQTDPAVVAARDAAGRACALLYQVRENALAPVYASPEYADLRLALWGKQRQLQGLYVEIPVRAQSVMDGARDAMDLRSQMTAMEIEVLEQSPDYLEARDDANLKMAVYNDVRRDALTAIRSNPEFVAASQRVQSIQRSMTGYRTSVATVQ